MPGSGIAGAGAGGGGPRSPATIRAGTTNPSPPMTHAVYNVQVDGGGPAPLNSSPGMARSPLPSTRSPRVRRQSAASPASPTALSSLHHDSTRQLGSLQPSAPVSAIPPTLFGSPNSNGESPAIMPSTDGVVEVVNMPIPFPTPAVVAEQQASLSPPQPPARKMSWEESTKLQQQAAGGQQGGGQSWGSWMSSRLLGGAPSAAPAEASATGGAIPMMARSDDD